MEQKKGTVEWILEFAGRRKSLYALSIVFAILSTACAVVPYILISMLVGNLINGNQELSYYVKICCVIAVLFACKSAFYSISTVYSHRATFAVLGGIRTSLCEKLAKVPLGYVKDIPSGTLKAIIMERVDGIETVLAHILPEFTSNLIIPAFIYIYMLCINWKLALLALIPVILGVVLSCCMFIGYEKDYNNVMTKTKILNDTSVEYINGIEVIKAFGKAKASYEKFVVAAKEGSDCFIDWMRRANIFQTGAIVVAPYTLITILPFGAYFYMRGSITAEALVTFIILAVGLVTPLITLMSYTDDLGRVKLVIKEVTDVLTQQELVRPETCRIRPKDYSVKLEDVHFSYHEDEVLHGINLKLENGTINAFVGPSGSGKSTIAKLIASLWDPTSGNIKIGGVDIKEIPLTEYNRMVAYVSQENYLFDKTIMENIRIGKPDASDEEVIAIAKKSGCHGFIMQLEKGYQTVVGGAGGHLSGGERQRISIARAMLKDASIIILDEATAYTDPENEAIIQSSVATLVQGKTLIVIAHRLSTITDADRIFVVENGKIENAGTHLELLEKSKLYAKLWEAHIEAKDQVKEGV